jgi:hypothetical protein
MNDGSAKSYLHGPVAMRSGRPLCLNGRCTKHNLEEAHYAFIVQLCLGKQGQNTEDLEEEERKRPAGSHRGSDHRDSNRIDQGRLVQRHAQRKMGRHERCGDEEFSDVAWIESVRQTGRLEPRKARPRITDCRRRRSGGSPKRYLPASLLQLPSCPRLICVQNVVAAPCFPITTELED